MSFILSMKEPGEFHFFRADIRTFVKLKIWMRIIEEFDLVFIVYIFMHYWHENGRLLQLSQAGPICSFRSQ